MTSSSEIKLNETVSMHKFKIWKSNGVRSDEYGEGGTAVNQQTIKTACAITPCLRGTFLMLKME